MKRQCKKVQLFMMAHTDDPRPIESNLPEWVENHLIECDHCKGDVEDLNSIYSLLIAGDELHQLDDASLMSGQDTLLRQIHSLPPPQSSPWQRLFGILEMILFPRRVSFAVTVLGLAIVLLAVFLTQFNRSATPVLDPLLAQKVCDDPTIWASLEWYSENSSEETVESEQTTSNELQTDEVRLIEKLYSLRSEENDEEEEVKSDQELLFTLLESLSSEGKKLLIKELKKEQGIPYSSVVPTTDHYFNPGGIKAV